MPIYEYSCKKCDSKFELLRHLSDTTEVTCPTCSGTEVVKVVSSFSCGGGSYGMSGCAPSVSS
ncbi:MAG: FmdB family zinc ribbon protein [Dehalogenimonas sp.]